MYLSRNVVDFSIFSAGSLYNIHKLRVISVVVAFRNVHLCIDLFRKPFSDVIKNEFQAKTESYARFSLEKIYTNLRLPHSPALHQLKSSIHQKMRCHTSSLAFPGLWYCHHKYQESLWA